MLHEVVSRLIIELMMKVELTAYNIAGEKLIVSETSELKPKIKLDYAYNDSNNAIKFRFLTVGQKKKNQVPD